MTANLRSLADFSPDEAVMLAEVLRGLSLPNKNIPSLYFYDQQGSELFDAITGLPEYYPTRTEISILEAHGAEIAAALGPGRTPHRTGLGFRAEDGAVARPARVAGGLCPGRDFP
jgi:uncharacterized SAM-dependent methyltransferase